MASDFWSEMREASRKSEEAYAEAAKTPQRGIAAKFAGTCAITGRRYGKGARIEKTTAGWALCSAGGEVVDGVARSAAMPSNVTHLRRSMSDDEHSPF